jgi:hypothetical protein
MARSYKTHGAVADLSLLRLLHACTVKLRA